MEIKTVAKIYNPEGRAEFDKEVNAALATGWSLVERKTLPGQVLDTIIYKPTVYAELVKLDPPPVEEPKTIDPLEAVRIISRTCETVKDCTPGDCPLWYWCQHNENHIRVAPKEWAILGKGVPE